MKKISIIMAVIALIIGCQPGSKPKPIDYRETPKPLVNQSCSLAEKSLTDKCKADSEKNFYCCQVVSLTKKGKSFTQFCEETQNAGIALNPECIANIINCSDVDKCLGTTR
jgi:hypothetical protein